MPDLRIAITGASGLVGSHLSQYLANKRYRVRALVRSLQSAQPFTDSWATFGIETRQANVLNKDELRQAFTGMDVVIHAAAIVDPYAPSASIESVNVSGSRAVLDAARQVGVKQLVFVSSLSVITGNQDQYGSHENSPLLLCGEPYADSKVQAEKIICANVNDSQTTVTVVRPGFIYGPRERAWLPQLIQAIAEGRAVLVDGGSKETNIIYVENLNRAIEATLLNENAYGQIYNLTDGQGVTKKHLFDTISKELNLPTVQKNLPSWLVKPIFVAVSSVASFLPTPTRKKLARFSMAAYRLIGLNQGFSITKAENELGYTKRIPFSAGMAETLHYFKDKAQSLKIKAGNLS